MNIKILREMHGLTQSEIAQIAGVTDKAVSTWENGTKEPRMGAVDRIARRFNVKPSDIIDEADIRTKKDPGLSTEAMSIATAFDAAPSHIQDAIITLLTPYMVTAQAKVG